MKGSLHPFFPALALGALSLVTTAQQPFTEEAIARGIVYFTSQVPGLTHGHGVSFADMDEDGDSDLLAVGGDPDRLALFVNDGSANFVDVGTSTGVPGFDFGSGVIAFDADADGDLDLLITRYDHTNIFAWNDGDLTFTPDNAAFGGFLTPDASTGPSVGDVDGDGWLDVHVPQYGEPDNLFLNQGDGTFVDVAAAWGVDDDWRGMQSVLFDVDWDGDLDLVVSNDKHDFQETVMHNRFYLNVGGGFVEESVDSGLNANIFSMGVAVGDFDGDLRPDLYFTNVAEEHNPLFINRGQNTFYDAAFAFGAENRRTSWGTTFWDYDNDSHTDLYVCNRVSISYSPQNRLYVHGGNAGCVDVGPALAIDDYFNSYCNTVADADGDGDLDMVVQNRDTNLRLYVNHEGSSRNWIRFHLRGEHPNPDAIGAWVSIRVGPRWQRQQLLIGGNGFKGQNELRLHFGLGGATTVDEAVIHWPDGFEQRLRGLAPNRTHTVRQRREGLTPDPSATVSATRG